MDKNNTPHPHNTLILTELIIPDKTTASTEETHFCNATNSFTPSNGCDNTGVTKYTTLKPPNVINIIRNNRNKIIKESKIVELTRKYQCERYGISRLTDSAIFEQVRLHLALFHVFNFTSYEGLTKPVSEILIKNQGLPIQESLFQVYLFFCQERGVNKSEAMQDLETCAANCRAKKEKQFDIERKRIQLILNRK